ncbi:MAG: hypothetical protein ACNA8K_11530 [Cyclonatronaceae bacterium]
MNLRKADSKACYIPAGARLVILSTIPVYRDEVEERGGMTMPPPPGFEFRMMTGTCSRIFKSPGATASPHIFRLHSASLLCTQYDGREHYPFNHE